jgi:hypothetical protein
MKFNTNKLYIILSVMCLVSIASTGNVLADNVLYSKDIEQYTIHEIIIELDKPIENNPFIDVELKGEYTTPDNKTVTVHGFCDDPRGSVFKIRFTPSIAGLHKFKLNLKQQDGKAEYRGQFNVQKSERKGFIRIDAANPKILITEEGSKPFFVSKTAWLLLGTSKWKEFIDQAIAHNINVLRFGLEINYYYEKAGIDVWPWEGTRNDPDYSRFNVNVWKQFDEIFNYALENDVYLEPVIFTNSWVRRGPISYLYVVMSDTDMEQYWRYLMARLGAYPNIVFFQLFNEYGNNKIYQKYAANYLGQFNTFGHLITTSAGTTHDAIWPNEQWNDLAINHSCTSSNPKAHGLKDYYYNIGKKINQYNKPGWIDESGRIRHGNKDPVYRRKEYWIWSMTGNYWNYHSAGGCDEINDLVLGPGENYVTHIKPFWERNSNWWDQQINENIIHGSEGIDFAFARTTENKEEVVLYLVNEETGKTTQAGTIKLSIPPGEYSVRHFSPEIGEFNAENELVSQSESTSTINSLNFVDDLVILIKKLN